jgi:lipopolysaccharide biosynthesis regulator YciM
MSVWGMIEVTQYEIEVEIEKLKAVGETDSKELNELRKRLKKYYEVLNQANSSVRP